MTIALVTINSVDEGCRLTSSYNQSTFQNTDRGLPVNFNDRLLKLTTKFNW